MEKSNFKMPGKNLFSGICLFLILAISTGNVLGEEATHEKPEEKEFDVSSFIMHHISDDYVWQIGKLTIPLPVMLYSKNTGINVFLSSRFHHGENTVNGYSYDHGKIIRADGESFIDLSITKNVFSMLCISALLVWLFVSVARTYKRNPDKAPRGLQGFFEPVILFVRDEIARPTIGEEKYKKYLPYLLSLFFFIWLNNMAGLIPMIPFGANVTGNIAVTFTLAFLTFIISNASGSKSYWKHMFWPSGIPVVLRLPIAFIEFVGIFTKHFALMIRLFANITAGHIVVLSIISLTFILGSYAVGVVAVLFAVFMNLLELLVAALQAYIFTMLTALFVGQAIESHDNH